MKNLCLVLILTLVLCFHFSIHAEDTVDFGAMDGDLNSKADLGTNSNVESKSMGVSDDLYSGESNEKTESIVKPDPVEPPKSAIDSPEVPSTKSQSFFSEDKPVVGNNAFFNEEPDLKKETRYYKIYKKYNKQPLPEESWKEALSKTQSSEYSIQSGDTLWGISSTLFGDGYFWPKVWSQNSTIANPHEIRKGNSIKFFAGTMERPPMATIVGASTEGEKNKQPEIIEDFELPSGVVIPETKRKIVPVLKNIPKSFPLTNLAKEEVKKEYGEMGISIEVLERPPLDVKVQLSGYIDDASPVGVGEVVEGEGGKKTASVNEVIFVRMTSGVVSGRYLVVHDVGKVDDPDRKETQGVAVDVEGEIEVQDNVNEQDGLYRALVLKAIHPVSIGSILINGSIQEVEAKSNGVMSAVGARIVGGPYETRRRLFTFGSIVFLNRGIENGIKEGDLLSIIANEKERNPETKVSKNTRNVGTVKVVNAKERFSTAVVTKADDPIYMGDFVGTNSVVQDIREAAEQMKLGKNKAQPDSITLDDGVAKAQSEENAAPPEEEKSIELDSP